MKESVLELDNDGNCDRNVGLDDNFIVGTMGVVEDFSVHQEPVGITSAIIEQAPTQNTMVSAVQCATVLTCVPMPIKGTSLGAPMLVQNTS